MPRLTCLPSRIATLDTRTAKPPPKEADPYYLTPEHRAWREEGLKLCGGQCEHVDSAGRRCFKSEPHVRLIADHTVEINDGGAKLDPRNRKMLCFTHHARKTAEEKRKRLERALHG